MSEYKVLSSDACDDLAASVNEHIVAGWEPIGGVSVAGWDSSWENDRKGYTESETNYVFAQAMIKRAEVVMERSQEVRQLPVKQPIAGSIPAAPATQPSLVLYFDTEAEREWFIEHVDAELIPCPKFVRG